MNLQVLKLKAEIGAQGCAESLRALSENPQVPSKSDLTGADSPTWRGRLIASSGSLGLTAQRLTSSRLPLAHQQSLSATGTTQPRDHERLSCHRLFEQFMRQLEHWVRPRMYRGASLGGAGAANRPKSSDFWKLPARVAPKGNSGTALETQIGTCFALLPRLRCVMFKWTRQL
jgi:hypothetical protein